MSVLESKQGKSEFKVFAYLYQMRRDITDLLLRDFGYSHEKSEKKLRKRFGGRDYLELAEREKEQYDKYKKKWEAFDEWFICDERQVIVDCLRDITKHVFIANSIYPVYPEELTQRRLHQDEAIGQCYRLEQELKYAIETLPVDINVYLRFSDMIQTEIKLIKSWRKANKKFGVSSEPGAYFANVNSNGNANYNNASNANGVRPDCSSVIQ